eukprot:193203-Pelagomonas_calceolata.AAC.1
MQAGGLCQAPLSSSGGGKNFQLCFDVLSTVRKGLGHIDPYFDKLADGMVAWIAGWQQLNPPAPKAV